MLPWYLLTQFADLAKKWREGKETREGGGEGDKGTSCGVDWDHVRFN